MNFSPFKQSATCGGRRSSSEGIDTTTHPSNPNPSLKQQEQQQQSKHTYHFIFEVLRAEVHNGRKANLETFNEPPNYPACPTAGDLVDQDEFVEGVEILHYALAHVLVRPRRTWGALFRLYCYVLFCFVLFCYVCFFVFFLFFIVQGVVWCVWPTI